MSSSQFIGSLKSEHVPDSTKKSLSHRIQSFISKVDDEVSILTSQMTSDEAHRAAQMGFELNQMIFHLQLNMIKEISSTAKPIDFESFRQIYHTELIKLANNVEGIYAEWVKRKFPHDPVRVDMAIADMPRKINLEFIKIEQKEFAKKITKNTYFNDLKKQILHQIDLNSDALSDFNKKRMHDAQRIINLKNMLENMKYVQRKCHDGEFDAQTRLAIRIILISIANFYPDQINQYDADGYTLLHYACLMVDITLVQELLSKKADIDIATEHTGLFPAHLVAQQTQAEAVDLLQFLERHSPDSIKKKSLHDITVLHSAAMSGNVSVIKWLTGTHKHCVYAVDDPSQSTALHYAVQHGHLEATMILFDKMKNKNIKNHLQETPLVCAILYSQLISIVKLFFEHGIWLTTAQKKYIFSQAKEIPDATKIYECLAVQQQRLTAIVEVKDVEEKSSVSLMIHHMQMAFRTHRIEPRILVLRHKQNKIMDRVNHSMKSCTSDTIRELQHMQAELVNLYELSESLQKEVLDDKAMKQIDGYLTHQNHYHLHAQNKDLVDQYDKGGYTLLHYVSAFGLESWVRNLMLQGAKELPSLQERFFPIHFAALNVKSSDHLVQSLTHRGAKDNNGAVLLHKAAESGNLSIVKWVIQEKKLAINILETTTQDTPLHKAAVNNHVLVTEYLLDKNANYKIKNKLGQTPLVAAIIKGNINIAEAFFARGIWLTKQERDYLSVVSKQSMAQKKLIQRCFQITSLGVRPLCKDGQIHCPSIKVGTNRQSFLSQLERENRAIAASVLTLSPISYGKQMS